MLPRVEEDNRTAVAVSLFAYAGLFGLEEIPVMIGGRLRRGSGCERCVDQGRFDLVVDGGHFRPHPAAWQVLDGGCSTERHKQRTRSDILKCSWRYEKGSDLEVPVLQI